MIKSIEEGRKEDGNRSIADKIIKRLHDLEKTVQNNYGRWAWELLQNAKDSIAETDRQVSIRIIYSSNKIEFLHNGNHFTEKDIRGLINQISSKEVEDGQSNTRTGRFGTGFLTTHLLSKEVDIEGIIETITGDYFRFHFMLDRNGKTTNELIPKIEASWRDFHKSTEKSKVLNYDINQYNTSFKYTLESEEQQEIAKIGVDEFIKLIPYVLAFITKIDVVEIIDNTRNINLKFQNEVDLIDGFIPIKQLQNGKSSIIRILYASNENVSIAVRVVKKSGKFEISNLNDIPKLFCDFPLIGTENFYFPIVVNSFYFNPQTERDGIWLMGEKDNEVIENKNLLEQAFILYKNLIEDLNEKPFKYLFNIAKTKLPTTDERYFDGNWYKNTIQLPLREFLLTKPIVELEDGTKELLADIGFPMKSYSKEIREKLWQYTFDLFPYSVSSKKDLHEWIDIVWEDINKITYNVLVVTIANKKNITKLSEDFNEDEDATFKWLNKVGKFIIEDENNLQLFEKNAFIPNENGVFLIKSALFIDEIKDAKLIEILQILGENWNDILIHHKMGFGRYFTKKKNDIALKITEKIKNTSNKNANFIKAINLLSEWFDNNPEEGNDLFSEIYKKRAELFMNTIEDKDSLYKVMRSKTNLIQLSEVADAIEENPKLFDNIKKNKQLYLLLDKYNINDLQQLRKVLDGKNITSNSSSLLPVTQEILLNMGISSLEEWQEAVKDKDLAALFSHKSTPSTDMFVYVQSLIDRAKKNIINHLHTLEDYNLENLDTSTAPTILAGILKDGKTISIVARPAYNGEVIIYYGSERDILDYEPSELWIDDGGKPKKITLGHLLKKAQIIKFPI